LDARNQIKAGKDSIKASNIVCDPEQDRNGVLEITGEKPQHIKLEDGICSGNVVELDKTQDIGLHETTNLHNEKFGTYTNENQWKLDRDHLMKLCKVLGLTELHRTQRIILDVDCEGCVRIYSKALMHGKQFDDVFNLLLSEES